MGCGIVRKVPGYNSVGCRTVDQSIKRPGCGSWGRIGGWAAGRGSGYGCQVKDRAAGCGAGCARRGASHLCGLCLPGCSGPVAAGPGCKASLHPSSRRVAVAFAPT